MNRGRHRRRAAEGGGHGSPRTKLAATLLFGLALGGGVAVAQWSAVGVGGGGVLAGSPVDVTVDGGSAIADLYPGSSGDPRSSSTTPTTTPCASRRSTAGGHPQHERACPADAVVWSAVLSTWWSRPTPRPSGGAR